jgi:hypothetical protein
MRRGAPLAALCSTQAVFGGSTALPSVVWQLSTCHLRATAAPDPGIQKNAPGGEVGVWARWRRVALLLSCALYTLHAPPVASSSEKSARVSQQSLAASRDGVVFQ